MEKIYKRIIAGCVVLILILLVSLVRMTNQRNEWRDYTASFRNSFWRLSDEYRVLEEEYNMAQQFIDQFVEDATIYSRIKEETENSNWNVLRGSATAYSPFQNYDGIQAEGDPSVTSIGMQSGPNVMAVDPKKIPYHSEVIVITDNGEIVRGIAGDTGGALRNNPEPQVDIFKHTYDEAMSFGRQDATILWRETNEGNS